jgi:hypothetical protein
MAKAATFDGITVQRLHSGESRTCTVAHMFCAESQVYYDDAAECSLREGPKEL